MASSWQYLTVQIVLTERKASLITVFPQLLKKLAKNASNFRKWETEKWLAQIFRKDLTERKLKKTRIKITLFASPSSVFFTQSGNRTSTASVGVLN